MKLCLKCQTEKPTSEFRAVKHKNGKSYLCSPCKDCNRKRYLKYNKNNAEKRKGYRKPYLEIKKKSQKDKYNSNPIYKRIVNLRNVINRLVNDNHLSKREEKILGIDKEGFKKHIEAQFEPWMNWENRGRNTWHLDHIIPLRTATTIQELNKLAHYTNIRPLEAKKNMGQ